MFRSIAKMFISSFAFSFALCSCVNTNSSAGVSSTESADTSSSRNDKESSNNQFWEGSQNLSNEESLDARAIAISAGELHTCAVTGDKKLACWGRNGAGQSGCNDVLCQIASLVDGAAGVRGVSTGKLHTCFVTEDGAAACFGDNSNGQCGVAPPPEGLSDTEKTLTEPVIPPELEKGVASIHAGFSHTCAVMETGQVLCFGDNTFGQTGQPGGRDVDTIKPTAVEGLKGPVKTLALGYSHSCAVIEGGAVQCWGDADGDQLGIPEEKADGKSVVSAAGLESGVVDIDAGALYSCAVKDDGTLHCWGRCWNTCGDLEPHREHIPALVLDAPPELSQVAVSDDFTCVLTKGGEVHCVGHKQSVFGNEHFEKFLGLPEDIIAIDAGSRHVCAVDNGGGVWCWGPLDFVGHTPRGRAYTIPGLKNGIFELSMTGPSICGRVENGARCFFLPFSNKAHNRENLSIKPTRFTQGEKFSCILNEKGQPLCSGDNTWSQLGDSECIGSHDWIPVNGIPHTVADITSRGKGSLALGTNGRVFLIGHANRYNDCGTLGCSGGDWSHRPKPPVEVTELGKGNKRVMDGNCVITAGETFTCLMRSWSGAVYLKKPAFVDSDAQDISQAEDHYCWIRPGGEVRCAGEFEYEGNLCKEPNVEEGACTIVDLDPAVDVAASPLHACALRQDGQVKCWGSGWIGDGTYRSGHSPLVVQGLPGDVIQIAAFGRDSCALTKSGAVYCWGKNIVEDYEDVRCDTRNCYSMAPKRVLGF